MMPVDPNVKHPAILEAIERTHARQKRRMERTPGKVKPINEIPMKQLLDEGDCAKDYYDPTKTLPCKPVETPVHDHVRLKLKRMEDMPVCYQPWKTVFFALSLVANVLLIVYIWKVLL